MAAKIIKKISDHKIIRNQVDQRLQFQMSEERKRKDRERKKLKLENETPYEREVRLQKVKDYRNSDAGKKV